MIPLLAGFLRGANMVVFETVQGVVVTGLSRR